MIKGDLLPETRPAAIKKVGEWLVEFKGNHMTSEKKVAELAKQNERLPILKNQIMEMAQKVLDADSESNIYEKSALKKLESWFS